jgi:hypothetical protein
VPSVCAGHRERRRATARDGDFVLCHIVAI